VNPGLDADAPAVEIGGLADAGMFVDVDIGVAKHAFDENRDPRIAERAMGQIGDIEAGVKLRDVDGPFGPVISFLGLLRLTVISRSMPSGLTVFSIKARARS